MNPSAETALQNLVLASLEAVASDTTGTRAVFVVCPSGRAGLLFRKDLEAIITEVLPKTPWSATPALDVDPTPETLAMLLSHEADLMHHELAEAVAETQAFKDAINRPVNLLIRLPLENVWHLDC